MYLYLDLTICYLPLDHSKKINDEISETLIKVFFIIFRLFFTCKRKKDFMKPKNRSSEIFYRHKMTTMSCNSGSCSVKFYNHLVIRNTSAKLEPLQSKFIMDKISVLQKLKVFFTTWRRNYVILQYSSVSTVIYLPNLINI